MMVELGKEMKHREDVIGFMDDFGVDGFEGEEMWVWWFMGYRFDISFHFPAIPF